MNDNSENKFFIKNLALVEKNLHKWSLVLKANDKKYYDGKAFHIDLQFSKNYPYDSPKLICKNIFFNVHIDNVSGVFLMKENKWDKYNVENFLFKFLELIDEPQANFSYSKASKIYKNKLELYKDLRKKSLEDIPLW